jgi:hypothetical protein
VAESVVCKHSSAQRKSDITAVAWNVSSSHPCHGPPTWKTDDISSLARRHAPRDRHGRRHCPYLDVCRNSTYLSFFPTY